MTVSCQGCCNGTKRFTKFLEDLVTARKLGQIRFHICILAGLQQLMRVCVGCAEQGNLEMLRLAQEAAGRVAGMETRLALDCPSARQRTPAMLACHYGCVSTPWIVTPPGSAAVRCTSPSWPHLLHGRGRTEACPHRRAEIWPVRLPAAVIWLSGHSTSIYVTGKAAGAGECCDVFGGRRAETAGVWASCCAAGRTPPSSPTTRATRQRCTWRRRQLTHNV